AQAAEAEEEPAQAAEAEEEPAQAAEAEEEPAQAAEAEEEPTQAAEAEEEEAPDQVARAEQEIERAEQELVQIREGLARQKKKMWGTFKKNKLTEEDLAIAEDTLKGAQNALVEAQEDRVHAEEETAREHEFQEMARRAQRRVGGVKMGVNGARAAAKNGAIGGPTGPKILLVEEDPEIRETTAAILFDAGYDVVAVANQDQAIEAMQAESPESIKLLMTDILANGTVNGIELEAAAELKARHPHLKTLFVSGQSDLPDLIGKSKVKDAGFLQRPFLGTDLVESARNMLTKDVA
ncbi:MAG: response regulator, partial [Alphaproteobacteria bacterium]|nr:response regulator [Alphaproteobacteria bacterium]